MASQDWTSYAKPNTEWDEYASKNPERIPDLGKYEVAELRQVLADLKRRMAAAMGKNDNSNVHETERQIPVRDGSEIMVRIHSPTKPPADGSPLAVIIHGGGFTIGGVENEEPLCRRLCEEIGFVCVNVDYRLAPEHRFPTAVHDCWDAVQWAAKNASELKADPSKGFIVGGTSAGGNLSAVVGHFARDEQLSPPLTGMLLMIPSVLAHPAIPEKYKNVVRSRVDLADAPILDRGAVKLFNDSYQADPHSELYSVFLWKTGHKNLPPTYFQICGLDPLRDEALLYEQVLREENDVKTKLSVYPGLPHGFWSVAPQLQCARDFVDDSVEGVKWLQSHVGR